MLTTIQQSLERVVVGSAQSYGGLTMVPLLLEADVPACYLTLDEALAGGVARVTEISEGGSVPELWFDNQGDRPVLLMDGEELVGARQNRVINLSILAGGHKKIVIPVSCVERGRWSYVSREFQAADRTLFASARAAKTRDVSESMQSECSRRANQRAVWQEIAEKSTRMSIDSATEAMSELYERSRRNLADYSAALTSLPSQAGAVFAIGGHITGAEVFDSTETFRKLFSKVLVGYALEAIDKYAKSVCEISLDEVRALLDRIARAPTRSYPSVGEGEDLRLQGDGVVGGALAVDNRIVHLCAFKENT